MIFSLSEKLNNESFRKQISKIGEICFYTGLSIELLILILEKSAYTNPVESWMFRIAFCFFVLKCLSTKYSGRDMIIIAVLGIVSIVSYLVNTRDELVRMAVFVVAMKNIDLKKSLKYVFWVTLSGMGILMILSLVGVLGTVLDPWDGYGIKEGTTRLCLGLGSANTLAIMVWAIMLLGICLYHERMKIWHYIVLLVFSVVVYLATYTRTTLATMVLTLVLAFLFSKVSVFRKQKVWYVLGAVTIPVYVLFSAWAAKVSTWHEYMTPFQNKINLMFTGRLESLSMYYDGGGCLDNWLLFSKKGFENYFDMGYVRMFYWYGIIPTVIMLLILIYMIYQSYVRNDFMGSVMIIIIALFTLFEAHFVNVYIARNYLLFLAGYYLFTKEPT